MSERLKEHDWKSCVRAKLVPRVQIPLSPPEQKGARVPGSGSRKDQCRVRDFAPVPCAGPRTLAPGPYTLKLKKPGPAQRESYEPRQVRKEAAVIVIPCAAGSLAFIKKGSRVQGIGSSEKRT